MDILFVHQNFPGQFRFIAPYLAARGHRVIGLGMNRKTESLPGVQILSYGVKRGNGTDVHPLAREFESKVLRGEACALAAVQMRAQGFMPQVIVCHPGWGEALYLKAVWPDARLVCLMEYFYRVRGQEMGFDPEFPAPSFEDEARLQGKNANLLLAMEAMDLGVAATPWQASRLPGWAQAKTRVMHEGIDTVEVAPDAAAQVQMPDRGLTLRPGDEVVTFVARNLEPVRGYHVFMRALPRILRERPNARVLIIGGDGVSYGARPEEGGFRQRYLAEVAKDLDPSRVHFVGQVSRQVFVRMMQVSACHVYLTYPFVLSWSMLEAMSAGAALVASRTAPVLDVVEHGVNGRLVDFFDGDGLADAVVDVLARPHVYADMRARARATIVEKYDLQSVCLPAYARLIEQA